MSAIHMAHKRLTVEPLAIALFSVALLWLVSVPFTGNRGDISLISGWAIVLLGMLPLLVQLRRGSLPVYPLFAMTGVFTGITYGLTPLFLDWSPVDANADHVIRSQIIVIVSFVASCLAYWLTGRFIGRDKNRYPVLSRYTLRQLQAPAWIVVVITEALETLNIEGTKEGLRLIGDFARAILYIEALRPGTTTPTKFFVLALLIPYDLVKGLLSGFTAPILIVGLYIFAGIYYWRRKIPWSLVLAVLVAYFVFSPVKHIYREVVWYSDASRDASHTEKIDTLLQSGRYLSTQLFDAQVVKAAASRFDHLDTLARIASDTPSRFPHLHGESMLPVIYKPIPRLFWPDKPKEQLSNEWAHHYGLLDPLDTETSFNLPWISELYMNFGASGCVWGMLLFGVLFRLLERHYFLQSVAPVPYAIGVTVCVMLWYAESNISLVWGGVPVAMVFLYVLARLLTSFRRPEFSAPQLQT